MTNILQDAVAVAFEAVDAVGPIRVAGTLSDKNSAYNEDTSEYENGIAVSDPVKAIKYDFKHHEIDGQTVRSGDTNLMVQTSELTQDYRTYQQFTETLSGKVWNIENTDGIPGESAVVFHARLASG